MKVLMVDKNEIFTTFMKNMVKDEIYKVNMGQTEEGYLAFFKQKPTAIITDNKISKKNSLKPKKHMNLFRPIENIIYISSNLNRFKASIKNLTNKNGGDIKQKNNTE